MNTKDLPASYVLKIMNGLSRREILQTSAITVVSGIAGCDSPNNSASASATNSPTPTDTPRPIDSPKQTETNISANRITEYESLTERGQELFQILLSERSIERPQDKIPSKLWKAEYVRYETKLYSVSKRFTGRSIAQRTLKVFSADQNEVNEAELVVFSELSEGAKAAFKEALNEGEYTARGETLPGKLGETGYVKYDGNYYELLVAHLDISVWRIAIEKINS